jgi:hypothetical protein
MPPKDSFIPVWSGRIQAGASGSRLRTAPAEKKKKKQKKPFWFQVFSLSRVVVPSLSWHVQDRFFSLTKLLRENKTLPKRVRAIPHLGRGAKPVAVSAAVVVAHVPGPARACARGAKGGQRCVSDARSGAELSRRGERAALLPAGEQR